MRFEPRRYRPSTRPKDPVKAQLHNLFRDAENTVAELDREVNQLKLALQQSKTLYETFRETEKHNEQLARQIVIQNQKARKTIARIDQTLYQYHASAQIQPSAPPPEADIEPPSSSVVKFNDCVSRTLPPAARQKEETALPLETKSTVTALKTVRETVQTTISKNIPGFRRN